MTYCSSLKGDDDRAKLIFENGYDYFVKEDKEKTLYSLTLTNGPTSYYDSITVETVPINIQSIKVKYRGKNLKGISPKFTIGSYTIKGVGDTTNNSEFKDYEETYVVPISLKTTPIQRIIISSSGSFTTSTLFLEAVYIDFSLA